MNRACVLGCIWLLACTNSAPPSDDGGLLEDAAQTAPDATSFDAGVFDATTPVEAAQSLPDRAEPAADASDASDETPAQLALCPLAQRVPTGCVTGLETALPNGCDGLDNNCDGTVDEGCPCTAGTVQRCFAGPPGRADVGACSYGTQVCSGGEFPTFGPCTGSTAPSAERCDGLDNDCNGCTDEITACVPVVQCPAADDPRIPVARPFSDVTLDAAAFVDSAYVVSAHWTVQGSPCDGLFSGIPGSTATSENGQLSYTLSGADTLTPKLHFTLSGSYAVSLKLGLRDGSEVTCDFPVRSQSEGLRVELCWDETGPTAGPSPVDLDLHLAKRGATSQWGDNEDCDFSTCVVRDLYSPGIWGHPNTNDPARCTTGGPLDFVHRLRGNCINPRLDLDNQSERSRYLPENINLDVPAPGEVFEIAVNHRSRAARRTHALVNVYCGGALRGSFDLPTSSAFSDLTSTTELWRVANVAIGQPGGAGNTQCDVSPLTSQLSSGAPDIVDGDLALRFAP